MRELGCKAGGGFFTRSLNPCRCQEAGTLAPEDQCYILLIIVFNNLWGNPAELKPLFKADICVEK